MAFAALASGAAWGQSYSAEQYAERSGKKLGKIWISGTNGRFESYSAGKTTTGIIRKDSAKIYILDLEKKTYLSMPFSQVRDLNALVGLDMETSSTQTKKFIKKELVEGFMCDKYEVKNVSITSNGREEISTWEDWIYQPLKAAIKTTNTDTGYPIVLRNVQQGPQAASLFEIPKGFTGKGKLPAGGIMELVTGKSKAENRKNTDDAKEVVRDYNKKVDDINKSTDDKLEQAAKILEMMQELKKKQ